MVWTSYDISIFSTFNNTIKLWQNYDKKNIQGGGMDNMLKINEKTKTAPPFVNNYGENVAKR